MYWGFIFLLVSLVPFYNSSSILDTTQTITNSDPHRSSPSIFAKFHRVTLPKHPNSFIFASCALLCFEGTPEISPQKTLFVPFFLLMAEGGPFWCLPDFPLCFSSNYNFFNPPVADLKKISFWSPQRKKSYIDPFACEEYEGEIHG